jgi:hypothetical protein
MLFFELVGGKSDKLFHMIAVTYEAGLIQDSQCRVLPLHNTQAPVCRVP